MPESTELKKIEITPEMVHAGVMELPLEFFGVESVLRTLSEATLVSRVYRAMDAVAMKNKPTPEMIEAGARVLAMYDPAEDHASEWVEDIYREMVAALREGS